MKRRTRSLHKLPRIGGKWKTEVVTPRHAATCCSCKCVPQRIRVVFLEEALPFPRKHILCCGCAVAKLKSAIKADISLVKSFAKESEVPW